MTSKYSIINQKISSLVESYYPIANKSTNIDYEMAISVYSKKSDWNLWKNLQLVSLILKFFSSWNRIFDVKDAIVEHPLVFYKFKISCSKLVFKDQKLLRQPYRYRATHGIAATIHSESKMIFFLFRSFILSIFRSKILFFCFADLFRKFICRLTLAYKGFYKL